MFIAIITQIFTDRDFTEKRFQTCGSQMEDYRFDTIPEGLDKIQKGIAEGWLDVDCKDSPTIVFINTDTFETHTYKLEEIPKKYVFHAI